MPFVKGQSGNPNGRSKKDFEMRAYAQQYYDQAIEKLVELMQGIAPDETQTDFRVVYDEETGRPVMNPDGTRKKRKVERQVKAIVPVAVQMEAAQTIIERAAGKPIQPVVTQEHGEMAPIKMIEIRVMRPDGTSKLIDHDANEKPRLREVLGNKGQ